MPSGGPPRSRALVQAAAEALRSRKDEVDRLNVFPVPDGDTGTNMSLTMDAVLAELAAMPPGPDRDTVCRAVTHGSLMGARGNSGVILSQMLRGLCEVVGPAEVIDATLVSAALERSTTVAFQAVRKPVEGTMLTVLKDSAAAAKGAAAAGLALDAVLRRVVDAAYDSVRRGPDLLPVLKENGVVDAGGFGLAILAEGFIAELEGEDLHLAEAFATGEVDLSEVLSVDDWQDTEYLYCTEFLLHGQDLDRESMHEWVASHGGSELVVGGADTLKIHVHTDDPATVLAHATTIGEVADVHINNMRRQTAARTEAIRAETPVRPSKRIGVVAVAVGDGLAEILRSLGVDEVISGGQTMNPSTRDLYEAVKKVHAETVIILPDNKNIILAASQVPSLHDRPVAIVPTTSVPQGFAAMLEFDVAADLDDLVASMTQAASRVRTGEVTTAVKDAKSDVGAIRAGQIIGLADDEIAVIGDDLTDVAVRLAAVISDSAETLTLLAGEDLADDALAALAARLAEAHPDLEVETHRGEQPLYPLIMSAE
ncbi:MAG: Dak phosphatase [Coriobacteriaceae bacterium]|nr:Dak phosphatase [Coriobacteriaceae bacterium]